MSICLVARKIFGLSLMLLVIGGCPSSGENPTTQGIRPLRVATTTSTRDSGLMDVLQSMFEGQAGIELEVLAYGTGQALELGRRGDCDVLLTHAPEAERKFIEKGFGEGRREIMYNDFVIVGPMNDVAGISEADNVVDALKKIRRAKVSFTSRGDNSGTHMKEQTLWGRADIEPGGDWYISAGGGMAHTLRLANEKNSYLLIDRGTFLARRKQIQLTILFEGDPSLRNQYAAYCISPGKHPHVNHEAARRFVAFLASEKTQAAIADFGKEDFGQPLFFPNADSKTD